jgi:hypothetical protein
MEKRMVDMKNVIKILTIVFISIVLVIPAQAVMKKVAQAGFQFLKIDMSARSAGMAGAFTMMGDDANAMFHNPSGIAYFDSDYDVFLTNTTWIADISYIGGGVLMNFGNVGTFGLNFMTADYGEIIGTRITTTEAGFEETGNIGGDVGAYAVGLVYAKQISEKFAMGGQIKYVAQSLAKSQISLDGKTVDNEESGTTFEFGTTFYPGLTESFRFGISIKNFSQEFIYEQERVELPLTFNIGFAVDAFDVIGNLDQEIHSLMIAFDAIHPRDYTERIHLGTEYWFMNMVALRTGYKFNYDEEGFSFGVGAKVNVGGLDLKLDYAYTDFGVFDNVNRISFGASF